MSPHIPVFSSKTELYWLEKIPFSYESKYSRINHVEFLKYAFYIVLLYVTLIYRNIKLYIGTFRVWPSRRIHQTENTIAWILLYLRRCSVIIYLAHFGSLFPFYTSWKHKKTSEFLRVSRGIEMDHWPGIG